MSGIMQFSIILGICLISELISSLLPIPFPGSVISMIVVFVMLYIKILKTEQIEVPTKLFIGNMAIIFLPASVGIMEYLHFIDGIVGPFLMISIIGTVISFAATAGAVRLTCYLMGKRRRM